MSALSNYLEGALLGHIFQGVPYTGPSTVYVALGTAAADGSFTELSGGGYARVAVTCNSTNWPGPTSNNGTVSNGGAITFPAATANWNSGSTIGYCAIYDASSAGNMLAYGAITTPIAVTSGAVASFAASALSFQIDN